MTTTVDTIIWRAAAIGAIDEHILQLEARLRMAQLTADVATLDALIADELLFAGPDGALASKAMDLSSYATGSVRFREHHPEALHVRRVGTDCVVVSLRARLVVEVAGAAMGGTFRYTRVWARENDNCWRVVAGQVSAAG